MSRRTIHEWIETGQLERDLEGGGTRYRPRPAVGHKLDPYKGIIKERLEEFPRLSAKRLYDEVRAAGYTGGYVRVRDYVRSCGGGNRRRRWCGSRRRRDGRDRWTLRRLRCRGGGGMRW